jgi:catechol 2,3-dioxygenase-like lactoylglutathione lyase family enzyme
MRVVQLTPPGSGCSIQLVEGGEPQRGLTLVVPDIVAVHAELTKLGAPLSDVVHFEHGKQVPGHSDEPWSTMVFFTDPDGNKWIMQERPAG